MPESKADERQCLYRGRSSQIFDGEAAIEAALEDGWVDHPDKTDPTDDREYDSELEACAAANQKLHQDLEAAQDKTAETETALKEGQAESDKLAAALAKANDEIAKLKAKKK